MALMSEVGLRFVARDNSRQGFGSFNRSLKTMSRTMIRMAAAGGGIYAMQRGLRAAITAASDLQETQAKFNVVFKEHAEVANKWAVDFGKSVGRSEESVKGWMARLQDTFVPLGIARDKAMDLSSSLVTLAVDVASFNNAADADVIRDFTSALVGNHETVRKYGIMISETAIKQEAIRQGINKTYKELTDLEKVQLRYNLIQRGSVDAQGDALRTADSYANQAKRLKANITDLAAEIGGPLMTELTHFVTLLNNNSELLADWLTRPLKAARELHEILKVMPDLFKSMPQLSPQGLNQNRGFYYAYPPGADLSHLIPAPQTTRKTLSKREKMIRDWWKYGQQFNTMNKWLQQGTAYEPTEQGIFRESDLFVEMTKNAEQAVQKIKYHTDTIETHWFRAANRIRSEMANSFDMIFENIDNTSDAFKELGKSIVKSMRMALSDVVSQMIMYNIFAGLSGMMPGNNMLANLAARTGNPMAPVGAKQTGGPIFTTGMYRLHAGEHVTPAGGPQVVINNNTGVPMTASPPAWDGNRIIVELETALTDRMDRGAGALAARFAR